MTEKKMRGGDQWGYFPPTAATLFTLLTPIFLLAPLSMENELDEGVETSDHHQIEVFSSTLEGICDTNVI